MRGCVCGGNWRRRHRRRVAGAARPDGPALLRQPGHPAGGLARSLHPDASRVDRDCPVCSRSGFIAQQAAAGLAGALVWFPLFLNGIEGCSSLFEGKRVPSLAGKRWLTFLSRCADLQTQWERPAAAAAAPPPPAAAPAPPAAAPLPPGLRRGWRLCCWLWDLSSTSEKCLSNAAP